MQTWLVGSALAQEQKMCRRKAGSSLTWGLMSEQEVVEAAEHSPNLDWAYVNACRSGEQDRRLLLVI